MKFKLKYLAFLATILYAKILRYFDINYASFTVILSVNKFSFYGLSENP